MQTATPPTLPTLPTATGAQARRFFRARLRPYRGTALAAGLVTLAAGGCVMVPPLATGRIVDRLSAPGVSFGDVLAPLALILASLPVGAVLSWWARVLFARVAEPTVATLREDVLAHALDLAPGVTEKAGTGELVSRVGDDSRLISTAVATVLPQVLSALALLVLAVPGLFGLHWALGLAGLVGVPMYAASLRRYLPRSAPLYRAEREILSRRTPRFLDAATGRDALISQGWDDAEVTRLDAASDESRRVQDDVGRMLTRYFQRNHLAEFAVTAVILVGFVLVDASWTTVGAVTAAALLYHRLFNPTAEVIGTFDRILAGIVPVQQGSVTLDGIDLDALGTALRPTVVLASPRTDLFAATMRQNLTLGAGEGDGTEDATVEDAVRACGADWMLDLPEGLDTRVGDDGHHLTAHQAQHLALVRLLLLDPGYVVLDEATAEDGSSNSRVLNRASAQVIAGRGALVIAHRLSQARLADRILVMDAGRIVEDGTHDSLVAAGGRYATLWAAWTRGNGRGEG